MMLTKHILLGLIMSFYNPSGITSLLTVKHKIKKKRLFSTENAELGWDDPVPEANHSAWAILIPELLRAEGGSKIWQLLLQLRNNQLTNLFSVRVWGGEAAG